jgi:Helix-turn-helix of DDE superfamily endonuclease
MYHTTGFTKAEIAELCARIETRELAPGMRKWPPVLGLRNALTATLTYLRRNRVQAEIAENYGVSQPTISRAISAITPLLVQALLHYVPTADELDAGTCYIVDGTLLPCWSGRYCFSPSCMSSDSAILSWHLRRFECVLPRISHPISNV